MFVYAVFAVLATVANNLFLVLGTAVFALVAIAAGLVNLRAIGGTFAARMWSRGLLLTGGTRLDVEFETPLDPDGCYVFLCNHQSLFDIPVLLWTLPGPTRFLAKRSLFQIPVFGQAMSIAGFIPVDRQDRSSARRSFEEAVRLLEEGTSVLVFPEETRSEDGRLLPFRRGAFLIALKGGVPLVPVGVSGTRDIRRKGSFWVRPGTVRVRYGAPVAPQERSVRQRRELVEDMRRRIGELAGAELGDGSPNDAASVGGEQEP